MATNRNTKVALSITPAVTPCIPSSARSLTGSVMSKGALGAGTAGGLSSGVDVNGGGSNGPDGWGGGNGGGNGGDVGDADAGGELKVQRPLS